MINFYKGKYKIEEKTGYCLSKKEIDSLSEEEKISRKKQMLESRDYIRKLKNQEI